MNAPIVTNADKVKAVRDYEAQTIGSENTYRHAFGGLIYTDGIKFVADTCGAHWLIDLVASWQTKSRVRRETFQLWVVTPPQTYDEPWLVDAWTDSPSHGNHIVQQSIEYSDFPVELCQPTFEFYVEFGTAMLKGER